MAVPEGVDKVKGNACKLVKSLYGLKQSPRCWNQRFNGFLMSLQFKRSMHDYCMYTRFKDNETLILILYVDDLIIAGRNINSINSLKRDLAKEFEMTDCGELNYFLGIKIEHLNGTISLSQETSIDKVLNSFGMIDCNPVKTPMEKGLKLFKNEKETRINKPYRELLGSLYYVVL